MMLDIAVAQEGCMPKTVSDIGFVRSSQNIADELTKSMTQAAIHNGIATGYFNVIPEQWIIRKSHLPPYMREIVRMLFNSEYP